MNGKLKNLRKKIDKIDSEILRKLAERFSIISKIAEFKIKNKLPVFDGKREKVILETKKNLTKNLELDEKMVEKIFKIIIEGSRTRQREISKIQKAIEVIKKGGVVVFPTDTVYGLLADARNKKAAGKIFKIKKRPKNKPLAVFVKDLKMAKKYALIDKNQEKFLKKHWPGKLTAILKAKNKNQTIGIRIPDYKLINLLFQQINFPLAQTSANISGKEATTKIGEVMKQFAVSKIKPDLIIDIGNLPKNKPSKIVDLTGEKPLIIRF